MTNSAEWYERATAVMPGGVNSPVRAFKAVGGLPPFVRSGLGARLTTEDGTELVDLIASWGAVILGHAHPVIVEAMVRAARTGTGFGVPTAGEVEFAELVCELIPSLEVVRMVNSGTEATASAIRLARAATGRSGIIKFEGCYHGHADPFLVKAGSGLATLGEPDSPGVPAATVSDTRVAKYNDLASVQAAFASGDIAGVIVEPVAGNMGVVPPAPGFLEGLRALCDQHGAVLVFDEVMTGFRVAFGGAQARFGITPDLTALGKIVAGGAPAAAYGGRADLMRMIAPDGPVYQAGTLAGNPISVAAGVACLRTLADHPEIYRDLEAIGAALEARMGSALAQHGVTGCVQRVGAMMTTFFGVSRVESWDDAAQCDRDQFGRYHRAAFERGVLLPPSQFEAMFLMHAHHGMEDGIGQVLAEAIEVSA